MWVSLASHSRYVFLKRCTSKNADCRRLNVGLPYFYFNTYVLLLSLFMFRLSMTGVIKLYALMSVTVHFIRIMLEFIFLTLEYQNNFKQRYALCNHLNSRNTRWISLHFIKSYNFTNASPPLTTLQFIV